MELYLTESSSSPSLRPIEVVKALIDVDRTPTAIVRIGCWTRGGADVVQNLMELRDPLERALEVVEA